LDASDILKQSIDQNPIISTANSNRTMPAAPNHNSEPEGLRVAIIGAGITGINLALGLQARNIPYTIYERAPGFREIGAGIGFSPNAERAMGILNPDIVQAYNRVANPNGEDYFQWVDGFKTEELMVKLYVGKDGFLGCRRSDILEEWAKLIPDANVKFGREVDSVQEDGPDNGLVIRFKDGSSEEADVVLGCDGIRSRIRQIVLPPGSLAAQPHYSSKYCFRTLVPMERAVAAIGSYRSSTRFMYNGHDAHIITYPIGNNTVLNVLVVLSDSKPWPDSKRHTTSGNKSEAVEAFKAWGPIARKIVGLLPDEMDKWAIFDMAEHPAPTYVNGRVGVAGDAAHAAGPHLGAGAGMGIEDALVLVSLLAAADEAVATGKVGRREAVEKALAVYNETRYERTQWLVQATREAVDLFQWQNAEVGSDAALFGEAIAASFHKVWQFDVHAVGPQAVACFEERIVS